MKGYVYVISNRAMPELYKIGYTMKDPKIRAIELSTTGVPHEYTVEYEILIDNPFETEQASHFKLKEFNEGKEWFRCSLYQTVDAIKSSYNGNIYYEHSFRLDIEKETARNRAREITNKDIEVICKEKEKIKNEMQFLQNELKLREENSLGTLTRERLKNAKFLSFFATLIPMFIFYDTLDIWIALMFLSCGVVLYFCSKTNIINAEKADFYESETWKTITAEFECKIHDKAASLEALTAHEKALLSSITTKNN